MSQTAGSGRHSVHVVNVELRPISPDDKALLACWWGRLSPESQRQRFLAAHPRLTRAELRYFTEVDDHDHVAWLATTPGEPDRLLGVGRWIRLADHPDTAEFAIVVGDSFRGQSVGSALAERLAAEARARGVRRFTAAALADNVAVRRLLEGLGTTLERVPGGAVDEMLISLAA
jgi:RimJ/RimL family protein N-acetyltransferase